MLRKTRQQKLDDTVHLTQAQHNDSSDPLLGTSQLYSSEIDNASWAPNQVQFVNPADLLVVEPTIPSQLRTSARKDFDYQSIDPIWHAQFITYGDDPDVGQTIIPFSQIPQSSTNSRLSTVGSKSESPNTIEKKT